MNWTVVQRILGAGMLLVLSTIIIASLSWAGVYESGVDFHCWHVAWAPGDLYLAGTYNSCILAPLKSDRTQGKWF